MNTQPGITQEMTQTSRMMLPYVMAYRVRGKMFYYVRKCGRRIRLPGDPREKSHQEAYHAALSAVGVTGELLKRPKPVVEAIHLYVIQVENGPVKIGRSSDPESRLKTLQSASAARLVLVKTFMWRGDEEGDVHREMARWRMNGEWFEGSPDALAQLRCLLGPMRFPFAASGRILSKAENKARKAAESARLLWEG